MKAAATVITSLTITSSAFAYQVKTTSAGNLVRWPGSAVEFKVEASSSADEIGAIRAGFEAWADASNIDFTFGGTTDRVDSGYDPRLGSANENVVRFVRTKWEADRSTLAITFTLYETTSGKIVSSDIILNAVNYKWTASGEAGAEDVQNTVTHEAGHFIGLSHSDVSGATMYPSASHGEISKRSLDADDASGASALYGVRTSTASTGLASQPDATASTSLPSQPGSEKTQPTDSPSPAPSTDSPASTSSSGGLAGCGGATIATRVDAISPLAILFLLAGAMLFAGRKRFQDFRKLNYKEVPIDKKQI